MESGSASLPLRGLALAGGDARRLDGRKASRQIDGETWLERAAQSLRPHCSPVYVSVRSEAETIPAWTVRLIDVDHENESQGPLAALHALAIRETCDAFVLACDYPLVSAALVESILNDAKELAPRKICMAVAPDGHHHPLVAYWPASALQHAAREYEAGERALHGVCRSLDVKEWLADGDALLNVNRPEDLARLDAALRRVGP